MLSSHLTGTTAIGRALDGGRVAAVVGVVALGASLFTALPAHAAVPLPTVTKTITDPGLQSDVVGVDQKSGLVFSAGAGGTLSVVDEASKKVDRIVAAASFEDVSAIVVDQTTDLVYVFEGVDESNYQFGVTAVGGENAVTIVDGLTGQVTATIRSSLLHSVTAATIDEASNTLYLADDSAGGETLVKMDGAGTTTAALTLGATDNSAYGPVYGMAYDSSNGLLYTGDGADGVDSWDPTEFFGQAGDGYQNKITDARFTEISALAVAPATHRLYIADIGDFDTNSGGVYVYDTSAYAVTSADAGTSTGTTIEQPENIAVNSTTGAVYVQNYEYSGTGSVSILGGGLAVTKTIALDGARSLAVDAATNTVVIGAQTLSLLDGASGAVSGTIAQDGFVEPLAAVVDQSTAQVFVSTGQGVARIDEATGAVESIVPFVGTIRALAVDQSTNQVYALAISDDSTVAPVVLQVDGTTGALVKTIARGSANGYSSLTTPDSLAVDSTTHLLYVANYSADTGGESALGSIGVIDPTTGAGTTKAVIRDAGLGGPDAIGVDESTHLVYVANATGGTGNGSVSVIDGAKNTVAKTLTGTGWASPDGVAVNQTTNTIYVSSSGLGDSKAKASVAIIDGSSHLVTKLVTSTAFSGPAGLAVDEKSDLVYVANASQAYAGTLDHKGSITVLGGATGQVRGSLADANNPVAVAVDQATGTVYTADASTPGGGSVTVITPSYRPVVTRASGTDRYFTSVAIAKLGFPTTAPVVYVADGTNFPDALGAAAVAAKAGGPLLLTNPTVLPAEVAAEITSLHPAKIVVVGSTPSVSNAVATKLAAIAPVTRLAGTNRYATSRAVVGDAFTSAPSVYIATGRNFPDALSASAAAGALGEPVVLLDGSAATLDNDTKAFLQGLGATRFTIAGSTASVSAGIATALGGLGTVTRQGGVNRYATSEIIDKAAFSGSPSAYFATGANFPDALAGAALAGYEKAPLYVVEAACVPDQTSSDLVTAGTGRITLFGADASLAPAVQELDGC